MLGEPMEYSLLNHSFWDKMGNWHMGSFSLTVSVHWDGSCYFYSGIGAGVAVPMVGWEAGGMGAVLYRLGGSKWGRNFRWDRTWWDGKRVSHCGIPIPFPSHPILDGIPFPFVSMRALR